mmetsp:Transcript_50730/g.75829  ORF Transcript_50730/g.75829 Transcript_50730/m.75829 type:complete len:226 (-) Transcript_50730:230-907(-)
MGFVPGDHVCRAKGPTGTVKHHGIVMEAEAKDGWFEVMEFGVFDKETGKKKLMAGHGLDILGMERGDVRQSRVNSKKDGWKLVSYNRRDSSVKSNAETLKAAKFLLEKGTDILPKYHITFSNGECVSRWCKTGKFESGQADTLYDSVNKAQAVSKVLPMAAVTKSATKSRSSSKSSKSGTATAASVAALGTVVMAVGTMVGNRKEQVQKDWMKTNANLDQAFAAY